MGLAALVIYKTQFFRQIWENPRVNSFFLNVSLCCISFQCVILGYISVIAPCCLRKDVDLEKDLPSIIPVMALCGVTIFICANLAMWPVWSFLTPIYMIVVFFGSTLSMMFLPSGHFGSLCFWAGAAALGYISHTMPHEPVW